MANETVQKGTALSIGFGTNVYTGFVMKDFSTDATGEITVIKGENNETITKLVSDLGVSISFTCMIPTAGSIVPPAKGSTITVNAVKYCVDDASVKQSSGVAELSIKATKEASMTYT
jgi:hypothetical protein